MFCQVLQKIIVSGSTTRTEVHVQCNDGQLASGVISVPCSRIIYGANGSFMEAPFAAKCDV